MNQEVRFWLNVAEVAHGHRGTPQTFMPSGYVHLSEAVAYEACISFADLKLNEAARLVPDEEEMERLIDAEPRYYRGLPERLYRVPPGRLNRFKKLIESDPRIRRVPKKAWASLRRKLSDGDLTAYLLVSDGSLWTFPAEFWRANTDTAAWAFHRDRLTVRVANPDPYGPAIGHTGHPIVLQSELEAGVGGSAAACQPPVVNQPEAASVDVPAQKAPEPLAPSGKDPPPSRRAIKATTIVKAVEDMWPNGEHANLLVDVRDRAIIKWHEDHTPPLSPPSQKQIQRVMKARHAKAE